MDNVPLDTSRIPLAQKAGQILELKTIVGDCMKAIEDLKKRIEVLEKTSN